MSNSKSNTELAKNPVTTVSKQVRDYVDKGTLQLPPDYSAENALKQAFIHLQENKLLGVAGVEIALMNMVFQGLSLGKTQCYFINYGGKLVCQRSYFGDMALVKRIMPGVEFVYSVFYKGESVRPKRINGKLAGIEHDENTEFKTADNIDGAYCLILNSDGEVVAGEVMMIDRIKKSWKMSKTYKQDAKSGTHVDFADEMALRTVIRKVCKPIINSSDDAMLRMAIRNSDIDSIDAEFEETISIEANQETIAIESEPEEVPPAGEETQPEEQQVELAGGTSW